MEVNRLIYDYGHHDHESYYGDRDMYSLVKMMEDLIAPIKLESQMNTSDNSFTKMVTGLKRPAPVIGGFRIEGFVPGNLVISAHSTGYSFDASQMNMSHVISNFLFGAIIILPLPSYSTTSLNFKIWEEDVVALDIVALSMEGDVDMLGPSILNPERLGVDDFEVQIKTYYADYYGEKRAGTGGAAGA
ncbi:Protein disulfide-isomerase 5-4 [Capsicum chinense]|nr:Protein disulfide-isomerase 5-4 [Capsicum chinense]